MPKKNRLDIILVKKKMFESRQKAKAFIMSGQVIVNNVKCDKPGTQFNDNVNIKIKKSNSQYVSRGGLKLEAALRGNAIDCKKSICLDVGASTGGFTDCLLQNGASKIFAVDVGYGQLAWILRQDTRVVPLERTNIRYMDRNLITDKIDIVTIDVSFISLKIVVPSILSFLNKNGIIVALIKPQFEVGKGNVGKKGVVKSPILHTEVVENLSSFFKQLALTCGPVVESPLLGPKGNKEFLILLRKEERLKPCELDFFKVPI